jgi:cytochrome c oxidase assembly protein subunit 15
MHVESTRLPRFFAFELTPTFFRKLTFAAACAVYVVVTTGAVVRLTASGLGCDNWPRCGDTPFPEKDGHAFIEFGNRVVALGTIAFTLASWLAARRIPGLPRWVVRLALLAFFGNVAQIPLGGLTVILDLHPLLVMSHFLLALVVLGLVTLVALEARRLETGGAAVAVPRELQLLGLALAGSCLALVVTGSFATAAGPHSGGADIGRLGTLTTSVHVHAVFAAVFGCSFLFVLGYLAARRERTPGLFVGTLALLGLLLLQVGVGELQWRTELPWGVVLVHVALAAAVWAGTVVLVAQFWRPLASVGRKPQGARSRRRP